MASISTLPFLKLRHYAKSRLFNEKFHFGHKISFLKSRLYVKSRFVKSRFVKSRLYCSCCSSCRPRSLKSLIICQLYLCVPDKIPPKQFNPHRSHTVSSYRTIWAINLIPEAWAEEEKNRKSETKNALADLWPFSVGCGCDLDPQTRTDSNRFRRRSAKFLRHPPLIRDTAEWIMAFEKGWLSLSLKQKDRYRFMLNEGGFPTHFKQNINFYDELKPHHILHL